MARKKPRPATATGIPAITGRFVQGEQRLADLLRPAPGVGGLSGGVVVGDGLQFAEQAMHRACLAAVSVSYRAHASCTAGHRDRESVSCWFERAIVAHSVAAEQLQQMQSGDTESNAQARKAINQRVESAAADLAEALAAYNKQQTLRAPQQLGR